MANDSVRIRVDTGELERALRDYMAYTSKTLPEAVEKIATDVNFQAFRLCRRTIWKPTNWSEFGGGQGVDPAFFHALATGKTKFGVTKFGAAVKGKGNDKIAEKIFNARTRATNYSAAIFLKLASDLGAKIRSRAKAMKIKHAKAKRAHRKFRPTIILRVEGLERQHVDDIIQPAMQDGINAVANDKREYINRKIAEGARRHSGR